VDLAALLILAAVFLVREWVHQQEMREEAVQRSMLLQRIQAPREIAYKEFAETLPPGAPSEPIWTDEDGWKALGDLPPRAEEDVSEWEAAMRASD
jgi:hypothetical protein